MKKTKVLILGIILVLLAMLVFLGGCYAVTTGTTTGTDSSTPVDAWTSMLPMLVIFVLFFAFIYFFTIRPQKKKQQEAQKMLQELQRGERVITNAGIYGVIESVYEDSFLIKIDSGATMRVAKWAVVGKQLEETGKTG